MGRGANSQGGGEVEPGRVRLGVGGDFFEDGFHGAARLPGPRGPGARGIKDQPGQIERPRRPIRGHGVGTEARGAPRAELAQGTRMLTCSKLQGFQS